MNKELKTIIIKYSSVRNMVELTKTIGLGYIDIIAKSLDAKDVSGAPFSIFTKAISEYRNGIINIEECLYSIDELLFKAIGDANERDWQTILSLLDQTQKFRVFKQFTSEMSDKDYWRGLRTCYLGSDLAHLPMETIEAYLLSDRSERDNLMTADELKQLHGLPDLVTIYRGCSMEEIESKNYRFSWTLNKEVAEFFADKYFRNQGIEGGVITLTVPKKEILAYLNDRDEEEVLYIHK